MAQPLEHARTLLPKSAQIEGDDRQPLLQASKSGGPALYRAHHDHVGPYLPIVRVRIVEQQEDRRQGPIGSGLTVGVGA